MKKYILLIILIISPLLLISCGEDINVKKEVNNKQINEEKSQIDNPESSPYGEYSKTDFLAEYKKIKDTYKKNEQFNSCIVSSLNSCLNTVILDESIKALNPAICDDLLDEYSKNSCKEDIQIRKAIESKNLASCDLVTEKYRKYDCRYQLIREKVMEKKDLSLCNDIYIKKEKQNSGSGTEVETFIDDFSYLEAQCISDLALNLANEQKDKKYCKEIKDEFMKKSCEESVQMMIDMEGSQEDFQNNPESLENIVEETTVENSSGALNNDL